MPFCNGICSVRERTAVLVDGNNLSRILRSASPRKPVVIVKTLIRFPVDLLLFRLPKTVVQISAREAMSKDILFQKDGSLIQVLVC